MFWQARHKGKLTFGTVRDAVGTGNYLFEGSIGIAAALALPTVVGSSCDTVCTTKIMTLVNSSFG